MGGSGWPFKDGQLSHLIIYEPGSAKKHLKFLMEKIPQKFKADKDISKFLRIEILLGWEMAFVLKQFFFKERTKMDLSAVGGPKLRFEDNFQSSSQHGIKNARSSVD